MAKRQTDDLTAWNLAAADRRHAETHTPGAVDLTSGSGWMAGNPRMTPAERAADMALLARQREVRARKESTRG